MKDQVTTYAQWEFLKKLGVPADKASMVWVGDNYDTLLTIETANIWLKQTANLSLEEVKYIPAYTEGDLMRIIPNVMIDGMMYGWTIEQQMGYYHFEYGEVDEDEHYGYATRKNLVALMCDRIEWLLSHGYKLEL